MGYYTRYELEILDGNDYVTEYESEISNLADYNDCFSDESIKWYNYEEDMKKYSKKHPNTVFCVSGEGEDNVDIWKAYFKNGKMFKTKAIILFENFSEDKLQ